MLLRTPTGRPGISLLEVLTAIFIMAIGMLALLTLFPLGALSMARAVRDDRAAAIAANAAALASAFEYRNDTFVEAEFAAFQPTDPTLPSNVVFIDPHMARHAATQQPLGQSGASRGIRRALPVVTQAGAGQIQRLNRWFTFQEEVEFETLGGPKAFAGTVNRPLTYTFGMLVRRPRRDARELSEVAIVVYANRATDSFVAEETQAVTVGNVPGNTLTIALGAPKPNIRKGTWIVDVTDVPPPPPNPNTPNIVNGHVYRVDNVTEGPGNVMTLELDRPLKSTVPVTSIVVLEKAIAVVERGTTWLP